LVIDDEAGVRQALSAMLQADGYAVVTAGSGKEAVEQSRRRHFDLAITDLLMPEMDGIQTMAALKGVDPALEVMVLTGHGGVDSAVDALRQGACDYLRKPLTMAQLCTAVAGALEKHQRNTPPSLFPAPASPTQKVMGLGRIRDREAWAYTLALALAVVMTASLLHFHIGRLYQEATAQWEARQSSVAEDRAQRVSDWLTERQSDAELFSNRPAVRAGLQAYHDAGQLPGPPAGGRAELTAALDEMASVYYYNGVYLLDSDAHLVAQSNYAEPLSPRLAEISRTVARTGALRPEVLSDARGKTLVSFSAPVFSRRGATAGVRSTDQPRGVVVLVVDASQTLFPILTHESIPTRTGETLLVRREGDDVVFFSPLRHVPAGSPNLRFPFSTAPLATRTALEGRKTFVEYKDYRGVPVLAATQYIPAAGWGMVHKIDRAEAYENVRQMAIVEELAAGLLIIMLGGLLAFHRRTVLMRALQQKEGEFRALLESAPDAMAITDREGRIVLVNAQAEILFGFGRNELIGQTLGMLFPEWARERSGGGGPEDFSEVAARHVGKTFEMRGLRKGGKGSSFEVRLSPVQEIEGGLFSCGIRDITQRKQAEQALARERDLLCALMDSTPDYIYFKDCQSRFLRINLAHAKALGLSDSGQAVGKTDFDFFPEEDAKGYFSDERQVIQTGQPLIGRVEKVRQADGQLRWVSTTKVSTRDAQGRITGLVGITRDVTERQRAEVEMEERHRLATLVGEVGAALTGAESLRQGLQQCTEILVRRINATFARVWTVNEAESVLELQASAGMYTHINGGHARVPMGKFKIGRIAESGEPHLTNSVREDSWVGDPEWARREGMVAFAGYPLKLGERVLGVVGAFARQPLTPATLQAFSSVAHNLARFIERKRTEEALRDGEEKYRVLYESSRDAIMMVAPPEWGFTAGNPAAIALFGARDEREFVAAAPWSLSPEYQPDGELSSVKARQNIDAAMERESHFFEWTHKKFSGEEFFATVTLTRMIHRGQPLLQATVRDITELRQAEEKVRESDELVRLLLDSIPEAVYGIDMQGNCTFCNPSCLQLLGYREAADLHGKNMHALIHHTRQDGTPNPVEECHIYEAFRRGYGTHIDDEVLWRRDGSNFPGEYWSRPIHRHGNVIGTVVTFVDITERKRAEEELRLTQFSMEHAADSIFWTDPQGRIVYVNEAACRTLERSREELLSLAIPDIDPNFSPRDWGGVWEKVKALGSLTLETCHQTKRGRVFPVEVTSNYIEFRGKEYTCAFARDITERKQAEADILRYAQDLETEKVAQEENSAELTHLVEELAHERDLLGTLMDNVPDAIYFKDSQSRFTRINTSQARVLGVADSRAALGKTDFDFFPPEDAQAYYAAEQKIIESGEPVIGALERHSDASGKFQWFSNTEVPIKDAQGRVTGIVGVARDVTEWKSTLEAFRESEERYRELFENASDLVYTTDLEGRVTSLNRVAVQTLGYSIEEAVQMNLRQLVDPKYWDRFKHGRQRLLAGESDANQEVEVKAKDGRRVRLEVKPRLIYKDGKPVGVQGIGRDITGREVAEMELLHAQKLEAVGRLASGIAHEINTPIQFVGDNTRFLQDSFGCLQGLLNKYQEFLSTAASGTLRPDFLAEVRRAEEEADSAYLREEIPKALTQTLEGITRVSSIVRAMKDFAHPESKEMAAADLNKALLSTLTVARNELKYVSDVETDFGDLPLVVCNVGDLNQVFLNLLVNAAHAISDVVKGTGAKGKIRVRTVLEGKTVLITISDTGGGIPEAIRARIYDPFFTTKEVGRGTGQGLAIARSMVVNRHKGSLTFESEVGKGTTFYIRLPLDPAEYSKETKAP
jgi:PAS domain S-box-containing protein